MSDTAALAHWIRIFGSKNVFIVRSENMRLPSSSDDKQYEIEKNAFLTRAEKIYK